MTRMQRTLRSAVEFSGVGLHSGQRVAVRGEVVRVSHDILGRHWVHLQDGTGAAGSDRLIFRSATEIADVGAVVTAEGTVDTDKDFGYGYQYSVLVENASFAE